MFLEQFQDGEVEALGAIEQHNVDVVGQIVGERLESVTFAKLDQISQSTGDEVLTRPSDLRGLELGRDDESSSVVSEAGREMKGRDAERGSELDDRARLRGATSMYSSWAVSRETAK